MIVDKKGLQYFRANIRQLSSRLFYRQFAKLPRCRVKRENNQGKKVFHYICAECGGFFLPEDKMIEIDHIEAVGKLLISKIEGSKLLKIENAGEYLDRLFCHFDNLQILCKLCHVDKTNEDVNYMNDEGAQLL